MSARTGQDVDEWSSILTENVRIERNDITI